MNFFNGLIASRKIDTREHCVKNRVVRKKIMCEN